MLTHKHSSKTRRDVEAFTDTAPRPVVTSKLHRHSSKTRSDVEAFTDTALRHVVTSKLSQTQLQDP